MRAQTVVFRPPVIGRLAPLGFDQPIQFQAMQRGIKRSFFDAQHFLRDLLNGLRDAVSVHGPTRERFQDKHLQRALDQLAIRPLFLSSHRRLIGICARIVRLSSLKLSDKIWSLMRIAVLGLGFMGSTHLKALRNVPGATLAAVVSSDDAKLAGDLSGIQGNLGGPGEKMDFSGVARYHTVQEALGDPNVDAVDICLPTDRHAPTAIDALRAGKHVLVEKPMALDGETADRLIAEAARNNRILMTAQVLRFLPPYQKSAELVKSAQLGAVRSAVFRRR